MRGRIRPLLAAIHKARREERLRYGETVYLLEPNIKRSRGGLRDIQLRPLARPGPLRRGRAARAANTRRAVGRRPATRSSAPASFCCWLRNEMHSTPARPNDVLRPRRAVAHRRAAAATRRGRHAAGRAVHARVFPPHAAASATWPSASWPRRWPGRASARWRRRSSAIAIDAAFVAGPRA